MTMRKRRKIALVVALAVLVVGPYLSADYFSKSGAPRFLTAPVIRADLEDAVLAMGTLQASRQVDVGTRVTGQLRSLKVHLGEHVRKDQLLAEIDPILPENELHSAEAHRQNLEAQQRATAARLRRAELEFRRQRQLIRTDATAKQTLDVAEADVRVQEAELAALAAQINQASVQVDTAKVNLAYTRITAPIDGDVVAIVTQEGQTVVAAQLVPVLLKLADLDTMTVKAQVSEADVIRIRVGQAVYFTIMRDPDNRYYVPCAPLSRR